VFVRYFNAFSILIQKTRKILKFGSAWIFTSDLLLLGYNWFFFLSWLLNFAAVSALQVIQQSTSLDLGWEDNSPIIWEPIDFLRELSDINLRLISPTLGDLLDLKTL
jgi:hypothetical protein